MADDQRSPVRARRPAIYQDLPFIHGPKTHDRLRQLCLPVAVDAGYPEDLAGAHLKREPSN